MKKGISAGIILIAGILTVLYILYTHNNSNTEEIRLSGTIEVVDVDISPEMSGRVILLNHIEGDPVRKGEILLKLDSKGIMTELRAAKAVEKTAVARVSIAKEQMGNAKKNFYRYKKLFSKHAISESSYDDIETAFKTASDTYVISLHSLDEVRTRMDSLNVLLEKTEIISPIDGIILEKNVEEGEVVYPGEVLMVIGDITRPWARVYIAEQDIGKIRLGQNAYVVTDAYPDTRFKGVLRYIADKAEFTPKNVETRKERVRLVFEAKVYLENPEGILKPGLPVDTYLPIKGD